MENQAPYLTFSRRKPGALSLMFKRAAELNAARMREKTIPERRELPEALAAVRPSPPGAAVEAQTCGGVPCEWIYTKKAPQGKVILYLHGGGWTFGNLKTARPAGLFLAEASGYRVLSVEYRLAPEHPFPAGLDDCAAVFDWLLENGFTEENIALFGDSAGGNLSLCLTCRLLEQGRRAPCAIGLASPVTDMTERSRLVRSRDDLIYVMYQNEETDIFELYANGSDRRNPLLSPVFSDLQGFPPMLIHVGGDEALALDCVAFSKKVYRQDVPVILKVYKGMFHDFSIVGRTLAESRQSVREFARFFAKILG